MRIAQLSDLHLVPPPGRLYGRVDTAAALATALARLIALDPLPDLLLFSGDLVDRGDPEDYAYLARCLAPLPFPYRLMPGNHDCREALMAAFPAQDWVRPRCHQRVDTPTGVLLLLDTVVPGEEGGRVDQESLAWLEAACPAEGRVLLFMHHPPFAIGIPGMDAIACRGSELLAHWLERHPNVEAVLCGHVHRSVSTTFAGRPALTAPSPAHQIALDFTAAPEDLAYTLEPGGFLLHLWQPGTPLLTHLVPCQAAAVQRYADLEGQ